MVQKLLCLLVLFLVPGSLSGRQVEGFVQGGGSQPSAAPPPKPATGRSTIRGRVATADGQPARRATVRIAATELRVPRLILTNSDGRYEFRDLPAGRYSITASKATLVTWSYGQTQPGSPGRPLMLAENQSVDNVNISMPRGAVVTGRIIDEFGEPVPNARVTLLRQQFRRGERMLLPAGNAATANDIGEYRLFGLAPGQYYLSAAPQPQLTINGPAAATAGALEGDEARNGYAPTFYPGTTTPTSAQRLTLAVGQTLSEINIVLLPTRTATIAGVAVDAEGRPLIGGFVQVMLRGGVTGLPGPGGPIRQDGTFIFPNVPPGEYVLRANVPRPPPQFGLPTGPPEFGLALITVDGEDIGGVRIAPIPKVSITGRVLFDNQAAAQSLNSSSVRVLALAATVGDAGIGVGSGGPLPVNEDLTFDLKTTPGEMGIRAVVAGWQVRSVRVNGTDVTDTGMEVGVQGVSGVEIEMTNRLQEVSGVVVDASGNAVTDYVVVIFPRDRSQWTAVFNRYGATARPGIDGRFKVSTLPAGDYYAIALDRIDAIEGQDPEVLEGLSRLASAFSLNEGETRTLDLKFFTFAVQ